MLWSQSDFKWKATLYCIEVSGQGHCLEKVPLLSDAELLMSPVIKEDSDCFLTVSFHIRRMRLCGDKQHVKTCRNIHSEKCSKKSTSLQAYTHLRFNSIKAYI